jgi:hypothetical protein
VGIGGKFELAARFWKVSRQSAEWRADSRVVSDMAIFRQQSGFLSKIDHFPSVHWRMIHNHENPEAC